ncbi:MAG: ATP-binding protein [Cyanobacteria bacterium P01_A01_bin.40]
MAKQLNFANRTQELDIFLNMAAGNYDCRIMLIEGASGMGKTWLLKRFKHKCPPDIKYIPFDCKGVVSIPAFLSQIVVDLGQEQFPTFVSKVKVFVHGGVDFSENDIAAEQTISIAINSDNVDPAIQKFRLEQLQQAFFNDLAKLKQRIVITLDTYQLANEVLRDWIESKWLRAIERQLDNVVTVIAGQFVPDHQNNSVWGDECEHFMLSSIAIDDWCKFCSDLPEDTVKGLALAGDGHPANVHQMLSLVIKRWSV